MAGEMRWGKPKKRSKGRSANMIRLDSTHSGLLIVDLATDDTRLLQTDWDYPGVASTFGWTPCCQETDGTVDCPHKTATEMINEAYEYLLEHVGDEVEDPGYFSG